MVILQANSSDMPQILLQTSLSLPDEWHVMVWHIQEDLSYFQKFPESWAPSQNSKHPQKFLESCAARFCLWNLCQQMEINQPIFQQDDRNRPFLKDSEWHISLTHAFPYAAAALRKHQPTGIDVEKKGRNIKNISSRFLASEEYARWHTNDLALTRAWSTKEAIYKAMAQPGLSFQEEIILPEFNQNPIIAQVQESELQVYWEDFDAFVLAIAGQI